MIELFPALSRTKVSFPELPLETKNCELTTNDFQQKRESRANTHCAQTSPPCSSGCVVPTGQKIASRNTIGLTQKFANRLRWLIINLAHILVCNSKRFCSLFMLPSNGFSPSCLPDRRGESLFHQPQGWCLTPIRCLHFFNFCNR